jgi:hypothetical protein
VFTRYVINRRNVIYLKIIMENRTEQNIWNAFFVLLYAILFISALSVLSRANGGLPTEIPLFDVFLIAFASFRLIRLFGYDKIMRWLRDLFSGFKKGPGKTISDLLGCPWCIGPWVVLGLSFFYFLIPEIAWLPLFVLSIAGVASVIQILSNLIGWSAEHKKIKATKK